MPLLLQRQPAAQLLQRPGLPNTTSDIPHWHAFCKLMDEFADGLAQHGLEFSTDVQWVTQAYGSKPSAELTALLGAGRARWITMDTYCVCSISLFARLGLTHERVAQTTGPTAYCGAAPLASIPRGSAL